MVQARRDKDGPMAYTATRKHETATALWDRYRQAWIDPCIDLEELLEQVRATRASSAPDPLVESLLSCLVRDLRPE